MSQSNPHELDSAAQILREYGQAMMRVGQLEKELALAKQGSQSPADGVLSSGNTPQQLADLQMKLTDREQEIVALRLQLETMQADLKETQNKLKLAAEGNYIRHRKSRDKKPTWKKILTGGS